MGAAADVVHPRADCGAVGTAEINQVLHVTMAVNQVLGQICTHIVLTAVFCVSDAFSCFGHRVENKTLILYIGAIQGVLSHFRASTLSGSSGSN